MVNDLIKVWAIHLILRVQVHVGVFNRKEAFTVTDKLKKTNMLLAKISIIISTLSIDKVKPSKDPYRSFKS